MANGSSIRRRPGQLREDIVAAATKLFLESGFDGTSMRDIAAAAGTTQAMLYRHFPGKADLFKETVLTPFQEFVAEFLATVRARSVSDLPDRELFALFNERIYDVTVKHRKLLLALLAAHEFSSDALGDLTTTVGPWIADLVRELKSEQEARDWGGTDIEVGARAAIAMAAGIALLGGWLFEPGKRRPSRKRILDELTEFELAGITQRS